MSTQLHPLDDQELRSLDEFLLERIDEDADTDDQDPGILNISELDGFFAALVSGPELPEPSAWLPAVWGKFEPEWKSKAEFETIMGLMNRLLNCIAATLDEAPADFEPLFLEHDEDGETLIVVDDWCEGYVRGVGQSSRQWQAGGQRLQRLLAPIRAFSSDTDWSAHEAASDAEFDKLSDAIVPNVRAIHQFWRERRKQADD